MSIGQRALSRVAWLTPLAAGLGGCAAVSTQSFNAGATGDGLVYYMPRQAIVVTITLDANGLATPSVANAPAEPDFAHQFVLRYESNLFNGNHAIIKVGASGLLQGSDASATSGVDTIAKNLGTLAGTATAMSLAPKAPAPACAKGRAYATLMYPEAGRTASLCGFSITLSAAPATLPAAKTQPSAAATPTTNTGVFYRQQIPYRVTVQGPAAADPPTEFLAFSPDESPILYYPVSKGFFGNTETNLTLTDGVLTQIDQKTDSELVGFTAVPADIVTSYFAAIGNIFGSRKTAIEDQTTLLGDRASREAAEAKLKFCQQTVASNPLVGKTPSDQATAEAAIKAACSA
jgi:hypothetical protein